MRKLLPIITLLFALQGFSQERKLTGTVLDQATRETLIGASVLVQETGKSAVTDVNGNFSILVKTGQNLKVVYVGYETLIRSIKENESVLTLELVGSTKLLESVVVTGYQTQRKVDLTGAVAVVDLAPVKNNTSGNTM